jgi:hypothetical protein
MWQRAGRPLKIIGNTLNSLAEFLPGQSPLLLASAAGIG